MTVVAADGFTLRPLAPGDVPLLVRWRAHPEVAAWFDEVPDAAGFAAKYLGNPARAHVTHAVAERDGEPCGYVQWYPCEPPYLAAAGLPGEAGVHALDVYLDPARLGQGLGHRLVRVVARHLRASGARRVLIDPEAANVRAVRAYTRAGFRPVRLMPAYAVRDGEARDHLLLEWAGE